MDNPGENKTKPPTDHHQDSMASTSKRSNQNNTPEVNEWIKREEHRRKSNNQHKLPHPKVTNNKVTPASRRNGGKPAPDISAGISAASDTATDFTPDFSPEIKFLIELNKNNLSAIEKQGTDLSQRLDDLDQKFATLSLSNSYSGKLPMPSTDVNVPINHNIQ